MGIVLATICLEEMLAGKINSFLRDHWKGEDCHGFVSGSNTSVLEECRRILSRDDKLIVLVESSLHSLIVEYIKTNSRGAFDRVTVGILTHGEENAGTNSAELFGPLHGILTLAYNLTLGKGFSAGTVALIYPEGRITKMFRGRLCQVLSPFGGRVRVVSLDEYGIGSMDCSDRFMTMMVHAGTGELCDLEPYFVDYQGVSVLDGKGCCPEMYELSHDESRIIADMICKENAGITLCIIGGGLSALNIEVLRRCHRILCIGEMGDLESALSRVFENLESVSAKTVNISSDTFASICSSEDWGCLWRMI